MKKIKDKINEKNISVLCRCLIKINKLDILKELCGYNDYTILSIKENYDKQKIIKKLNKENDELRTHIMCMPDGKLYFEAKCEWNKIKVKK